MKIDVEVQGVDALIRRLKQLEPEAQKATGAALYQEAEQIMTRSKSEFVPVQTGVLRGTGHVNEPQIRGSSIEVTMGYGGPAAPYALKQHEDLTYHHDVGTNKYLEKPTLEAIRGMPGRLVERIRKIFK